MMLGGPFLIVEARLLLLQVTGVRQDDGAQVDRRRGGIDRPVEALLDQPRNPTAMVEVRMREDHCVYLLRRNRHILPVSLPPLFVALEQPTVDQDLKAILAGGIARSIDEMLGAGHGACGPEELDVCHSLP